jgi:hypothetical protein
MKSCEYCGHENEDNALHCKECGTTEFVAAAAPKSQPRMPSVDQPDMKWSKICKLFGPTPAHAFALEYKLQTEFGEAAKDLIANSDFMTFREFVGAACQSKCV